MKEREDFIKMLEEAHAQNKEIVVEFNGGGDSGVIDMSIGDENVENKLYDYITNKISSVTGNVFCHVNSANGTFHYVGNGVFEGNISTIHYDYDESFTKELSKEYIIKIHKDSNFDSLSFDAEGLDGYNIFTNVLNGVEEKLSLDWDWDSIYEELSNLDDIDSETCVLESFALSRSVFTLEGDYLIYKLKSLSFTERGRTDEGFYVEL